MSNEMTDKQAQRLVEWLLKEGFSNEKAYEALAYIMGVKSADKVIGSQPPSK